MVNIKFVISTLIWFSIKREVWK